MPSKQVIETNKLKIGSSGATGLYVGGTESKYAVVTDSSKNQTVIYDKVTYNFGVTDLASNVPASGGTYNIVASTSTRTHGNGSVDSVSYSPTSITIPANTGSSYSSSVTVTQATSNLTDAYNFTVTGDSVKSIALTISNPATIPAAGGSVNSCTTSATVTYYSGRQITTFTPTSVNFNTVTAASKGTTTSNATTAGTLTCYIVYGGVTSNTASVYVLQAKNEIVSYCDYGTPTGKSISSSKVPASGGTSTITWAGTPAQTRKPVYTSTATGSSVSFTPTISTAVTGNSAVASKGTTISNDTTAIATVTGYYWANGKTASTTCSVTQAANYVTGVAASGASGAAHFSYSNIAAGATSASPSLHGGAEYTFTSGSKKFDSTTSPSFGGSATYTRTYTIANTTTNGFTGITANSGALGATSRGTTIGNARTSATVTGTLTVKYTHASTYSGGGSVTSAGYQSTATCTQNGNYVTSISVAGQAASIANIPAGGGSKTPTGGNGTVTYTFSSTSTSTTAPGSTYGSISSSVSYAMTNTGRFTLKSTSTGEVSATSKTTSIENVTNANTLTKTVSYTWTPTASYNAAGTKTCSGTATCTPKQDGNYVSAISVAGQAVSYAAIPAAGGSKTDGGGNGTVTYTFTSTSTSTSTPSTTYGSLSLTKSYSMTASGRFTLKSTTTGEVSATTKGTSVEAITSSDTVTKTVSYTWTPTSSYAGGTKTCSGTATGKATQAANAVVSYTDYQTPTGKSISGSQVPAAGGTSTITWSGTAAQNAKAVYTSTATASTYTNVAPSVSTAITGNNAVTSKGTTVSNVTTAQTVTGYYWANGKTASTTCYVTQAANAVVSYTDYQTPTGKSISGSQVPAAGGTSTITWSGTAAQNAKAVYTSTATASTYTNVAPSVSTAVTGNSAVASKGTTISNATTAIATVTGYYWANGKTASTTCSVTQAANHVTSIAVTGQAVAIANIGAGGGSKTPTGGNGTVTYTFTSTSTSTTTPSSTYGALTSSVSYAMTATGRFTLKSTSSGEVSATSKTTSIENVTNANTLTKTVSYTWTPASGYNGTGTKTCSGTATCTPKQDGNYVTSISVGSQAVSYAAIPAAGGSKTDGGSDGTVTYTFSSTSTSTTAPSSTYGSLTASKSYAMTNSGRFTLKSTTTGEVSATTKGTSVEAITSSDTITKTVNKTWTPTSSYNAAGTKTCSGTATGKATQAANAVTSYTDYQTPTGKSISSSQVGAGGGTSTITWAGTAAQNAKPVYTSTATGSSYVNIAPTVSTAVTGNSAVASKGTTISNATTAIATVTGYYWANGKTASTTCSVTQAGNYVTSIDVTGVALSFNDRIGAGGGTITDTGSNGSASKYYFTSGSNTTTAPSSTYGSASSAKTYSMTNGNGFYMTNSTTGQFSADTRGTTVGDIRSSNQITKTVTWTWKHSSTYGSGSVNKAGSNTGYASQYANAVTASGLTTIAVSAPSGSIGNIPASGGSVSFSVSASGGVAWTGYTSGSSATTTPTKTWAYSKSNGASLGGTFYKIDGGISASTKGANVSYQTSSSTVTVYAYVNNVNGNSQTGNSVFYATQAANSEGTTEYNAGNSGYTATVTIGNGMTAAGGSATVTYGASHIHYYRHQYSSGSYTGWYTPTVTDSAKIEISSNGNNRFTMTTTTGTSASNTITLSHSNMTTNAVTDNVTVKVTNLSNTSTTNTASKGITNQIESTKYNEGNSAWTATVSIGNGMTAAGGSATVTHSAGHTHYWQQKYTSGSYVGSWYTSAVSDTSTIAITSNGNSAFSLSNNTLSHNNMTTNARTDSVTVTVTNASNTSTTNTASKSITNQIESTKYDEGNSAFTASVSIGNGMTAAGGSATVTHSAGHTHYWRQKYTSGSYTGWYTSAASDTSTIAITSNGNSAFSLSNNTLTHSNMTTNARTDSVTVTVTNASNTSTTNTASKSITNQIETTKYNEGNSAYTASVSIGNGMTAAGGSATVTHSAGHTHYWQQKYTSGSYVGSWYTSAVSDTSSIAITSNGNSAFSLNGNTLTHSNMTTNARTDSVTVTVTNASNTSTTNTASKSITNQIETTKYNEGNSAFTASVSIGNGMTAAGGSATVTHSAGHTHYWQQKYTSGSYVASWYTSSVSDTSTIAITSNGNSAFSLNGNTLSHNDMGTNARTDSVTVTVTNASNTSTTNTASKSITNQIETTKYNEGNSAYTASISIGNGCTAAGGSATVTASAGHTHYWRQKYTSGSYVSGWYTGSVSDTATVTETEDTNNRFSYSNGTLTHSSMGTWTGTEYCTLKVTNASNTSTTSSTRTSVTNSATWNTAGYSGRTVSVTIASDSITAAGGSATLATGTTRTPYGYYSYTSGSRVPTSGYQAGSVQSNQESVTLSLTHNGNNRFSLSGLKVTHSNMTTNVAEDTWVVKATCAGDTSVTSSTGSYVSNEITSTTWNNPSITSPSGSIGQLAASADTKVPTLSATQSGTNYYTSGSIAATSNSSFTWTSNKSNGASLGGTYAYFIYRASDHAITASTMGTNGYAAQTSSTVTLTCTGAGNKTAQTTYYATRQANTANSTYGNLTVTSPTNGMSFGTIPAYGGTVGKPVTGWIPKTITYTSGSQTATTSTTVGIRYFSYNAGSHIGSNIYVASVTPSGTAPNVAFSAATRGVYTGETKMVSDMRMQVSAENGTYVEITGLTVSQYKNEFLGFKATSYSTYPTSFNYSGNIAAAGGTKNPDAISLDAEITAQSLFSSGPTGSTTIEVRSCSHTYSVATACTGMKLNNTSTGQVSAGTNTAGSTRRIGIKRVSQYNGKPIYTAATQGTYAWSASISNQLAATANCQQAAAVTSTVVKVQNNTSYSISATTVRTTAGLSASYSSSIGSGSYANFTYNASPPVVISGVTTSYTVSTAGNLPTYLYVDSQTGSNYLRLYKRTVTSDNKTGNYVIDTSYSNTNITSNTNTYIYIHT